MVRGPPAEKIYHSKKGDGKIQSLIPWIGGKQALCRAIISRFPADFRQRTYVEVFGGGASVLLNKERSTKEVYNDFNSSLVNLFRVVREHPKELQARLRYRLNSREDFDAVKARLARGHYIDPILWAADFYQLIRQSYGGRGTSFGGSPRSMWASFPLIDAVAERFQYVVVEHMSYERLIKTHDGDGTLFYLDPPYVLTEDYYGNLFSFSDHMLLAEILVGATAPWLLSYNDCEDGKVYTFTADNDVVRGGIAIQKRDSQTGETPQGNADFAGIVFEIVNSSANPVVVNDKTIAPNEVAATITTDENGYASTEDELLPYGHYTVREKSANASMLLTFREQTVDVTEDKKVYNVYADNDVVRGGLSVQKLDSKTGEKPQGDANFAGIVFEIINDSENPVVVGGTSYAPGKVVKEITTNATGFAATGPNGLPYGDYLVREKSTNNSMLLLSLNGSTKSGRSVPPNCPGTTVGFPQ
jgi:site-specific DNA-adenine methylase